MRRRRPRSASLVCAIAGSGGGEDLLREHSFRDEPVVALANAMRVAAGKIKAPEGTWEASARQEMERYSQELELLSQAAKRINETGQRWENHSRSVFAMVRIRQRWSGFAKGWAQTWGRIIRGAYSSRAGSRTATRFGRRIGRSAGGSHSV